MQEPNKQLKIIGEDKFNNLSAAVLIILIQIASIIILANWAINSHLTWKGLLFTIFLFILLSLPIAIIIIFYRIEPITLYNNGISPHEVKLKTKIFKKRKFYHFNDIKKITFFENTIDINFFIFLKNNKKILLPVKDLDDAKLIKDTFEKFRYENGLEFKKKFNYLNKI